MHLTRIIHRIYPKKHSCPKFGCT